MIVRAVGAGSDGTGTDVSEDDSDGTGTDGSSDDESATETDDSEDGNGGGAPRGARGRGRRLIGGGGENGGEHYWVRPGLFVVEVLYVCANVLGNVFNDILFFARCSSAYQPGVLFSPAGGTSLSRGVGSLPNRSWPGCFLARGSFRRDKTGSNG